MRISDWSSDVCSSDLPDALGRGRRIGRSILDKRSVRPYGAHQAQAGGQVKDGEYRMSDQGSNLDRVLVLEMVRVIEAAAVAAAKLIGRGDEKAADDAAVEAMHAAFNPLYMDGPVVICERDRKGMT